MIVDCLYRVAPKCAVVKGSFDLKEGRIIQQPSLYEVDIAAYFPYYELNYKEYFMANVVLANVMCKYPTALLAVNYNNIGAIVVFEDKCMMHLAAINSPKEVIDLKERLKLPKARVIGIAKMPVLTLEVMQPLMYLAAVDIDGEEYIPTEKGPVKLRELCDNVTGSPSGNRYFEMCHTQDVLGNCSIDGKVEFLRNVGAWVSKV